MKRRSEGRAGGGEGSGGAGDGNVGVEKGAEEGFHFTSGI